MPLPDVADFIAVAHDELTDAQQHYLLAVKRKPQSAICRYVMYFNGGYGGARELRAPLSAKMVAAIYCQYMTPKFVAASQMAFEITPLSDEWEWLRDEYRVTGTPPEIELDDAETARLERFIQQVDC